MRFVVIVIFILMASVVKGQTPTFTFQCVCDYLTAADSTCDICNTTTQSRFFKGLLIYKNGVAHKWIEQPYTIIQNFDALTFKELIPGAETIRIELRGTAFDSIAQFRDSVLCPCAGTGVGGREYIAGPGIVIEGDTISAVDTSATNELQNLFDTISVAGQQSIVPNSQHTKLTLIEGVGITITTDSTAREITIEADTSLLATVNDIDVITLADSAELKAYTGIARGVVLRQAGREGLFTRTTTSRAHDGFHRGRPACLDGRPDKVRARSAWRDPVLIPDRDKASAVAGQAPRPGSSCRIAVAQVARLPANNSRHRGGGVEVVVQSSMQFWSFID